MWKATAILGTALAVLLAAGHDSSAQRGGRGGGGGGRAGGGGGVVGGGYSGGRVGNAAGGTVIGPAGGTRSVGAGSGSVTTPGGATVNYGGAAKGGTTPGGVSGGRGVGGVQVTTPGGKTATKVGTAGGVSGPGGNAVGGRAGAASVSGPGGSMSSAYRGGVAVGPQGAAAGGARVGTATGPGGTVTGGTRGAAAVGPYGAAAGKTTVGRGTGGTFYASRTAMATTGTAVRSNFRNFAQQYPGLTARWLGPTWRPITWGALASYGGYPAEPAYYDYGETVVYSGDTVVINGETEIPAEQFDQQATDIAAVGLATKLEPKGDTFQSLGVFAMVQPGEEKSTNIFQLSVSKEGVIRGEYYNALTDKTEPLFGSVDAKTQRAAWTVGDQKTPVYEVGIANLTRDETTMLVHFGKDNRKQFMFVRLPEPNGDQPPGGPK